VCRIGLPISKALFDMLGGKIWLGKSEKGIVRYVFILHSYQIRELKILSVLEKVIIPSIEEIDIKRLKI